MKMRFVYKFAALLLLSIVLQARKNGPGAANDPPLRVTGAPGDGTCGNSTCHTDGAFNPSVAIELLDDTTAVDKYEPGKTYTVRITNTPGTGNPSRYGFQAVALNAANQQAGDWLDPGSGKHTIMLSNREYVEHSLPLSSNIFELPWEAPDEGTGDVTFYTGSTATNNNNSSSGDGVATGTLTVEEGSASNVATLSREYASMEVLPNPAGEVLNLRIVSRTSGNFNLRILDAEGRVVKMEPVSLNVGVNHESFNVNELNPGLYILQLCGHGHLTATQMLKL